MSCIAAPVGTPVVAERTPRTQAPAYYDDAVTWFEDADLEEVFIRIATGTGTSTPPIQPPPPPPLPPT